MNGTLEECNMLYNQLAEKTNKFSPDVEVMIAPPFLFLKELAEKQNKKIIITAQNCANKEKGAYTGEISVSMLKSIGIKYIIVGHSERRLIYGESIKDISEK